MEETTDYQGDAMNLRCSLGLAALLTLTAPAVQAAQAAEAKEPAGAQEPERAGASALGAAPASLSLTGDPSVGMVINRTVTVLGREFYRHFAAAWRELPESKQYSVSVHERPSAIRGSQMWVQYGQRRVFQTYLSPARSAAKSASIAAAEVSYKNVLDIDVARLLFQDKDLGPEEI